MKDYSNHNVGDLCIVTDKKLVEEPTLLKCISYSEYEERNPEEEASLYVSFTGVEPKLLLENPTGLFKVEAGNHDGSGLNVFAITSSRGRKMRLYVTNEHAAEEKRLPENVVPFVKTADCSKRMYSMLNHASNKKNKITIDGEEAFLVDSRDLRKTVKDIKEGAVGYVTLSRIINNSLKEEKFHPKKLTEVTASQFDTTNGAVFKLLMGIQADFETETRAYFIFKRSDITLFTDKKEEKEKMNPTILKIKPEEYIYSHVDDKQESVLLKRRGLEFKERVFSGEIHPNSVYAVFYESYGNYIKAGNAYAVHGNNIDGFYIKSPEGSITSLINGAVDRTIDSFELFTEIYNPKASLSWSRTTCKIKAGKYTDSVDGVYINGLRYTVVPTIEVLPKTYKSHLYIISATSEDVEVQENGITNTHTFTKGSPVLFTTFYVTAKRDFIHLILSQLSGYVILAPSQQVAEAVMLTPVDATASGVTDNIVEIKSGAETDTWDGVNKTWNTANTHEATLTAPPKKSEEKDFLNKNTSNKTKLHFSNPNRTTKINVILLTQAIKQKVTLLDLDIYSYLNLTDSEVDSLYEQALIDNPVSL